MSKVCIFLAEGFEEVEALTVVDLLRRANIQIDMVSISDSLKVRGRSNIEVTADVMWEDSKAETADMLILPGGMPGVTYLGEHTGLTDLICKYANEGKLLSAICAAPTVFGQLGILAGKKATCYPGLEGKLTGAEVVTDEKVVTDGNITTSRGVGTAIAFALRLITILADSEISEKVGGSIVY
ncbi:MAG: DJ-1/PfpI family protein [Lachnospiraceae bacterium]|nr:DJ-1/PfpI family protein [Lachnospiraceae bacterium]